MAVRNAILAAAVLVISVDMFPIWQLDIPTCLDTLLTWTATPFRVSTASRTSPA